MLDGQLIPQNLEEADAWLERAAAQGYQPAQVLVPVARKELAARRGAAGARP
jgi:TPR repeat protein